MNARVRLDATSEYRDIVELTRTERARVCGVEHDDKVASWCDARKVRYSYRDVYARNGRIERVALVLLGRDVAAYFGHYGWTDDYDERDFNLTQNAGRSVGSIGVTLESVR